jgi:hypothetical protein
MPTPSYYAGNPLQPTTVGQLAPPLPVAQGIPQTGQPQYANPPQQIAPLPNTAMPVPNAGMPAMPGQYQTAPAPQSTRNGDEVVDADDAQWVLRAKRAILSTHGDPHRQVQLIQHLRAQYLKQRYGRAVHTDEA